MIIRMTRAGVIAGRVFDSAGNPVSYAVVTPLNYEDRKENVRLFGNGNIDGRPRRIPPGESHAATLLAQYRIRSLQHIAFANNWEGRHYRQELSGIVAACCQ